MKDETTFDGLFEFIDIGRDKVTKIVRLKNEDDIFKAVAPHLMSQDIEYSYNLDTQYGEIFVGCFRQVGTFRRMFNENDPLFEKAELNKERG